MNRQNLIIYSKLRVILPALLVLAGCSAPPAPGSSPESSPTPVTPPANDSSVVVSFVNATSAVVETQFYATNEAIEPTPDELFVPANLITEGIGVAGGGLLTELSADSIEFPCSENLVLGTAGGRFLDPDVGTEQGEGTQRIVQEGLVFDCGAVITFTYKTEGDGYTVEVDHE